MDEIFFLFDSFIVEFFFYNYIWVGREDLIVEFLIKVKEFCCLFIFVGFSGIGKIVLVEKLVVEL